MDTQYFNGYRFTLSKNGKYYRCAKLKKNMHRYVWEYYNGEIPKGYEIHHVDFDRSNNDISNLQMLSRSDHRKLHAEALTTAQRNWRRNNLNEAARPKAMEWHGSEEGKIWHANHAKKMIAEGKLNKKKVFACEFCGKQFGQVARKGHKFCSGSCQQKYRRRNGLDNEERICTVCGKAFLVNKSRSTQTCSKSCTAKYQWRERYESKISNENNKESTGV